MIKSGASALVGDGADDLLAECWTAPPRVIAFVGSYHLDFGTREPTDVERRLIQDALVDFVLDEDLTLRPARARVAPLLTKLAELASDSAPAARPGIALIERAIIDLAAQLDRREDANLTIREHLVMLSEENRQLRLCSSTREPDPPANPGDPT